jgi:transposase
LRRIEQLTDEARRPEREIDRLSAARYPVTRLLRQVPGVGAITSLAYVLTLEDPARFRSSRAVGAYLGLRPRRRDSGERTPQLRITKAGDVLGRPLVSLAQYVLGPFGPDTDLLSRRLPGTSHPRLSTGDGRMRRSAPTGAPRS